MYLSFIKTLVMLELRLTFNYFLNSYIIPIVCNSLNER